MTIVELPEFLVIMDFVGRTLRDPGLVTVLRTSYGRTLTAWQRKAGEELHAASSPMHNAPKVNFGDLVRRSMSEDRGWTGSGDDDGEGAGESEGGAGRIASMKAGGKGGLLGAVVRKVQKSTSPVGGQNAGRVIGPETADSPDPGDGHSGGQFGSTLGSPINSKGEHSRASSGPSPSREKLHHRWSHLDTVARSTEVAVGLPVVAEGGSDGPGSSGRLAGRAPKKAPEALAAEPSEELEVLDLGEGLSVKGSPVDHLERQCRAFWDRARRHCTRPQRAGGGGGGGDHEPLVHEPVAAVAMAGLAAAVAKRLKMELHELHELANGLSRLSGLPVLPVEPTPGVWAPRSHAHATLRPLVVNL